MADLRHSLRVAIVIVVTALLTSPGRARTEEVSVSLHYASEAELEHARRVASELASEGYAVEISSTPVRSPCDADASSLVTPFKGTKAWIRLAADPANADRVVAFICYLGAQPLLQHAVPSAPRAEDGTLALAAAEALNGLRARLPALRNEPEIAAQPSERRPAPVEPSPSAGAPRRSAENSLVIGTGVVRHLPDFPTTLGITARGTLGVIPSLALVIDVLAPTAGGELASEAVTARIRTGWVRLGPRVAWVLGDFELSAAALAGPAFTWATAVASSPRVGTADIAPGAILTLGAFLQYPAATAVFGCVSASGSLLLPAPRINLGEAGTAARGYWPVDASIGLGLRWGG